MDVIIMFLFYFMKVAMEESGIEETPDHAEKECEVCMQQVQQEEYLIVSEEEL